MQKFTLPYGHEKVSFSFADNVPVNIITGGKPETDASEVDLVRNALENPAGAPLLWEVVNDTDRVVVALPDITRKPYARIIVPEILRALMRYAGVPVSHITLLFTCGLHRAMTDEEHRFIVGDEVIDSGVIVRDHVRESETVKVGKSSFGAPIELSKLAVEADRVILTGGILAHHFAGFSGGRKSVLPGIASYETIRRNHARTILPGEGLDPSCWVAILDGNPVHTEMMDATGLLNPDYLINAVPGAHGGLIGVVAGHWREAWLKGTEICKEHTFVQIDKPMELVVTTSGGYPKDLNFVQFHKAINNTCRAMRDGGALILLAEGENGWGNPKLREWCLRGDLDWICSHDADEFLINMNSAGRFIQNVSRFNVIFVTKLPKEDIEKMGAHHADTIDEALEKAYSLLGTRTPETTVIENGNITVPQIKG